MTNLTQNARTAAGIIVNAMTLEGIEAAKEAFLADQSLPTTFNDGVNDFTLTASEFIDALDFAIKRLK
ncbi:MAG: hypothetical protein GXZ10_13260 [Gammaproteobacteria bacterium]|nr:hypothetical protein [Gammaproteobacteria bacterium]